MIVRYEAARRLQDAAVVDSDLIRRMGRALSRVLLFASGCRIRGVLVVGRRAWWRHDDDAPVSGMHMPCHANIDSHSVLWT